MNVPCTNSNCKDTTSYQCFCPNGYTGVNCEIFSNPCLQNPCLNQGICQVLQANLFQCQCRIGFSGFYCQFNDDICQRTICLTNFTNQVLSVYNEGDTVSFDSYRSCIVQTWISLNPNGKLFFFKFHVKLKLVIF